MEQGLFDGLAERLGSQSDAPYATEDIEAALEQAEALLSLPHAGATGNQQRYTEPQRWGSAQQHTTVGVRSGDQADGVDGLGTLPRPLSAFSLGEQAVQLRLTAHEKEMELLSLRQQYSQLAESSERMQQQMDACLRDRDARIARLEDGMARCDQMVSSLTAQLQAYGGLSPEAATALQSSAAALQADKAALQSQVAELQQRQAEAARRVDEGVSTWERIQAELQQENARLAAALARQQADLSELFQEKEILRAKAAMLEARANSLPLLTAAAGTSCRAGAQQGAAGHASAIVARHEEAQELRQRLAAALEQLEAREATARKYKEAVRALKRRVKELEQQLEQRQDAEGAAAGQLQAAVDRQAAQASKAAAALQLCEQQLEEARQRCEQYSSRLAQAEAQVMKAELERGKLELRARDAEQQAQQQADGQAAELQSQAKAASLRALQLERQLAQVRKEVEALRQQQAQAAQQQQRADKPSMREQALVEQLQHVRSELVAATQQHGRTQRELKEQLHGKAVALAASEKKLQQLGVIMRRLAGKQASGDLIGSQLCS